MAEPNADHPSYELLARRNNSWDENDDTLSHPEESQSQSQSQSPSPSPEGSSGAPAEGTRPPRVRFRSVSNTDEDGSERPAPTRPSMMPRADSDYSLRSVHSYLQPTVTQSSDLADYDEHDDHDYPNAADAEAAADTTKPAPSSPTEKEPVEPVSARDRWRNASKLLRQKTVLLGERLGRPLDDVGDLGAAMLPEDLEGGPPRHHRPEEQDPFDIHHREGDEPPPPPSAEAHRLPKSAYAKSGQETPDGLGRPDSWYGASTPGRSGGGGGGILSQLLKLHAQQANRDNMSMTDSDSESVISSGTATPRRDFSASTTASGTATPKKDKVKWYKKSSHHSTASLVEASMNLSRASLPASADTLVNIGPPKKKGKKRKTRLEDEIRVTVHIAEILARQRYIMQLCRALMRYGAPTHRLEEYMQMTARVLEVEGQFLYLPGCMIMSFDDPTTRTAEVKLVRVVQGVDLGRLAETHNVYKNVVHDMIGVEEAIQELDFIMKRPPRFNKWILVVTYGLASVAVGPFAFDARPIDMPIIFFLGCLVGLMQHVLAPRSVLYSNVFEVTAAILTSFLARAFGSIYATIDGERQRLFCFSALAQSSIALILPGFMVLCSSLELQSHQMIAGSIRMVYSIIYSLFLGYGITVGTTIYGLIDGDASSQTTCSNTSVWGSKYTQHFVFVPIYVIFLAVINQGKWKQVPVMIVIAVCGYVTNYFSTLKLGSNSEVANTVGAFTIGLLGNLYSRLWHGHAATAILPGIFVLVPSGLASSGSLLSGIEYANEVRENLKSGNSSSTSTSDSSIASLGFGMIQVAIGITVGLFISALIVYPYGKRRSGLFSF
ncbi:DUF1212 domain membrane protein [Aspergillus heteromorphus CBS 117.55]|uniref:DUF1212 domain membrane protein n=1 Tax=Aspergillus heteromorphus CBS 117.55 TaxID=1448321 RepID=A0A317WNZ5_9EURO|nr:DUF1212 domain membrane protein [Aspergillus heteromorphus CBS 117.55]PWY86658.1 DUF1212 domain membrane protein [Aspergillus heteromorphus CBS 117.55]